MRPIVAGQIADDRTSVTSGLAAGEHVVTSGQYRLQPGTKVAAQDASQQMNVADQKG
jgi:membrane fusion protein, multidrug efflux system